MRRGLMQWVIAQPNPTQPNPTQPNPTHGLTQPMDNSGSVLIGLSQSLSEDWLRHLRVKLSKIYVLCYTKLVIIMIMIKISKDSKFLLFIFPDIVSICIIYNTLYNCNIYDYIII